MQASKVFVLILPLNAMTPFQPIWAPSIPKCQNLRAIVKVILFRTNIVFIAINMLTEHF